MFIHESATSNHVIWDVTLHHLAVYYRKLFYNIVVRKQNVLV